MNKFEIFTGHVGADQGCLEAWNLLDIETGITMIHHTIGDHVLGRSTCGVVFAEETEQGKLRHLRTMRAHQTNGYDGLGRKDYLWTLIERDGGLYKAKFLTADAIDLLTEDDLVPIEAKPAKKAKNYKPFSKILLKDSWTKGYLWFRSHIKSIEISELVVLGLVAILLIVWVWYYV